MKSHVIALCDDDLFQRTVARWLQAPPPGQEVLYGDYEAVSSLQFYLERKRPILNSWSKDLFPPSVLMMIRRCLSRQIITADRLRILNGQRPVYLVIRRGKLPRAMAAVGGQGFRVAAGFHKVVALTCAP